MDTSRLGRPDQYGTAALVVFWPQAQHEAVIARWPQLVEHLGASWDEHRQRTEWDCALINREGLAVNQIAGTPTTSRRSWPGGVATRPDKDDLHALPGPT